MNFFSVAKSIGFLGVVFLFTGNLAAQGRSDWSANCSTLAESCVLSQTVMSDERIWLSTVRILVDNAAREGDQASVEFLVPAGVHLASGLFAAVGPNQPKEASWVTCSPTVCLAEMTLTQGELAQWKQMVTAELRYRPRLESDVAAFNISLIGLTAGLFVEKAS